MKETDLQAVVASLFERFPELVGFSVREAKDDLCLSGVETFPPEAQPARLMGAIAAPLLDMLDEDPAAGELLSGRTFARTLH
jgi:hypothetical protein